MGYVEIVFKSSLYEEQIVHLKCVGGIKFDDGYVHFLSGGHGYEVAIDRIVEIKPGEE